MNKSLIVIPTYNEVENISRLITQVFALHPETHILIIDDNSPDGTADKVTALQAEYPSGLFLLKRNGKQGLGTAYITGFRWALERDYEYIFEMDADFSHPPAALQQLFDSCAVKRHDVSIGSRYVRGGKVVNWPAGRVLMSYYASVYVRLVTWMPVQDTTAGYVCFRRKVLESIDLDKIKFIGYAFQIEMKYAAWCMGFRIHEVPITFADRVEGNSKMSKGIFREAVTGVLMMRWNSLFKTYRKVQQPDLNALPRSGV